MKLTVSGRNLEVTPALRTYAEKKVGKLERFLNAHSEPVAAVLMRTERENQIVELTLTSQGLLARAEGRTPDMYASVDEAVEKIERQIHKARNRWKHQKQNRTKVSMALAGVSEDGIGVDTTPAEDEEELAQVVRVKRYAWKPMSVEEALTQMELLGHDFFVFTNADTEEVNVVYRRKDGNYGLIEPE